MRYNTEVLVLVMAIEIFVDRNKDTTMGAYEEVVAEEEILDSLGLPVLS